MASKANNWTDELLFKNRKGDYQKLSAELAVHFREQHLQQLFPEQLITRKKKVGNTLQDFEIFARKLVYTAHPMAPAEILGRYDKPELYLRCRRWYCEECVAVGKILEHKKSPTKSRKNRSNIKGCGW